MKELIDKLSSYNLFNYLLPGTLFAVLAEHVSTFKIIQSDIVVGLFLYYFIGLVISRIGSLAIEPVMRRTSFVKFAPYKDFVSVAKQDPTLEILSEANNMYRTLCALFMSLGALRLFDVVVRFLGLSSVIGLSVLFAVLFLLFAFAYRKQTAYIVQRIEAGRK